MKTTNLFHLSALLLAALGTGRSQQCNDADADADAANKNDCTAADDDGSSLTTKLRLGLEWFTNPDHLPLVVAQKHGIFREFGLDVELIEPKDHWEAEEEILAGRLDVAVTEPLHLAQDAAKGKPVLGFSRFLHTDGGVLYDAGKGGITRPADMCGAVRVFCAIQCHRMNE